MFCPTCGKEVPENTQFCGHCGAQLNPAANDAEPVSSAPEAAGLSSGNVLSWEAARQGLNDPVESASEVQADADPGESGAGEAEGNDEGTYQKEFTPRVTPDFTSEFSGFPEEDAPASQPQAHDPYEHRASARRQKGAGRAKLSLSNLPMLISLLAVICAGFSFVDALISSIHYRHFYLLAFLSTAAFAYLAVLFFIRRFDVQIIAAVSVQCLVAYTVFARTVTVANFFYFLAAAVLLMFMLCLANPRLAKYKRLAQYLYLAPAVVGIAFFVLYLVFSFRGLSDLRYYYGAGSVTALHYLTLVFQGLAYLAMTALFFFIPYWMREKDPIRFK